MRLRQARVVMSADLFIEVPGRRDGGPGSPRCSTSPGNSRGFSPCPRSGDRPDLSASPRTAAGREASRSRERPVRRTGRHARRTRRPSSRTPGRLRRPSRAACGRPSMFSPPNTVTPALSISPLVMFRRSRSVFSSLVSSPSSLPLACSEIASRSTLHAPVLSAVFGSPAPLLVARSGARCSRS